VAVEKLVWLDQDQTVVEKGACLEQYQSVVEKLV